jgi:hypothetical protein
MSDESNAVDLVVSWLIERGVDLEKVPNWQKQADEGELVRFMEEDVGIQTWADLMENGGTNKSFL